MSPLDRAQNLFNCLEHENEGSLTKEEFIAGYLERNVLMEKQDVQEQRIRYYLVFWNYFSGSYSNLLIIYLYQSIINTYLQMLSKIFLHLVNRFLISRAWVKFEFWKKKSYLNQNASRIAIYWRAPWDRQHQSSFHMILIDFFILASKLEFRTESTWTVEHELTDQWHSAVLSYTLSQ